MIKIVYEEQNLRTAAYDGDKLAGQCTYVVRDGFWDLEHTIVDPAYGGQGLAGKLVQELVSKAREPLRLYLLVHMRLRHLRRRLNMLMCGLSNAAVF